MVTEKITTPSPSREVTSIPGAASRAMRIGATTDAQLAIIIQQVKVIAMTVDPAITECWVTWEESGVERRLSGFFFKRGGQQDEAAKYGRPEGSAA